MSWHIFAVAVASIPPPAEAIEKPPSQTARPDFWPTRAFASKLDTLNEAWTGALRPVWNATGPIQRVTGAYTRLIGLEQRWNMFSEPPDADQYVHIRYFTQRATSVDVLRVDREIVFPAEREDRFWLVNAAHYEEKAVRNARQAFAQALSRTKSVRGVDDLPRDLLPVLVHYAHRYRRQLEANERLVRAELWLGWALVPPPGEDQGTPTDQRLAALRDYLDDPRPTWVRADRESPIGLTQHEADITWTLVYFTKWP